MSDSTEQNQPEQNLRALLAEPIETRDQFIRLFSAWIRTFEPGTLAAIVAILRPDQSIAFMRMAQFLLDEEDTTMQRLIAAANLTHQHRCDRCDAPLVAFSREADSRPPANQPAWRCEPCGGTVSRA